MLLVEVEHLYVKGPVIGRVACWTHHSRSVIGRQVNGDMGIECVSSSSNFDLRFDVGSLVGEGSEEGFNGSGDGLVRAVVGLMISNFLDNELAAVGSVLFTIEEMICR
jgi:hypothetical protein